VSLKLLPLGVRETLGVPTPKPAIWDFFGLIGTKSSSFRSINSFDDAEDGALDRGGVRGSSIDDQEPLELNEDVLKAAEKDEEVELELELLLLRGEDPGDLCDDLIEESNEPGTCESFGRGVKLKAGSSDSEVSDMLWKVCSIRVFGEVGVVGTVAGSEYSDPVRLCVADGIAKDRSSSK